MKLIGVFMLKKMTVVAFTLFAFVQGAHSEEVYPQIADCTYNAPREGSFQSRINAGGDNLWLTPAGNIGLSDYIWEKDDNNLTVRLFPNAAIVSGSVTAYLLKSDGNSWDYSDSNGNKATCTLTLAE